MQVGEGLNASYWPRRTRSTSPRDSYYVRQAAGVHNSPRTGLSPK